MNILKRYDLGAIGWFQGVYPYMLSNMYLQTCPSGFRRISSNFIIKNTVDGEEKSTKVSNRNDGFPKSHRYFLMRLLSLQKSVQNSRWKKSSAKIRRSEQTWLVVWPTPSETYARQNGFIFPKDRDENSKSIWNHHPDPILKSSAKILFQVIQAVIFSSPSFQVT